VLADRPGWRPTEVASVLNEATRQRPAASRALIRDAMLALAAGAYDDQQPTRSPRRLLENGPWWTPAPTASSAVSAPDASAPVCPAHPWSRRNRVGSCQLCAAEALAPPDEDPPEAPSRAEPAEPGAPRRWTRAERAATARAAIQPNPFAHVHRTASRGTSGRPPGAEGQPAAAPAAAAAEASTNGVA
jgi:hypothetical protein